MKIQRACTLLDLIQTVNQLTNDDQEVVATVVALVNSGRVRLCGNFAGAKITLSSLPFTFPVRAPFQSGTSGLHHQEDELVVIEK